MPLFLGVRTGPTGAMLTMISQYTLIPTGITKKFYRSGGKSVKVFEGMSGMADWNRKLGELSLEGLGPEGGEGFDLTFEIDANGLLTVIAEFEGGGKLK